MNSTLGLLLFLGAVAANFAGMIALTMFVGPKRRNTVKDEPFECGSIPVGPNRGRFHIRFYLTAMLFLIFDVEVVLLLPSIPVLTTELGVFGLQVLGVFVALLVFGLVYEWKRGGMEWD